MAAAIQISTFFDFVFVFFARIIEIHQSELINNSGDYKNYAIWRRSELDIMYNSRKYLSRLRFIFLQLVSRDATISLFSLLLHNSLAEAI